MSALPAAARPFFSILLVSALTACQPVLTSAPLEPPGKTEGGYSCQHSAGAYALPRHTLTATVTFTDATSADPARYDISIGTPQAKPDGKRVYCLDFLFSILSEDKISISRAGLLLTKIDTSFDDKTIEIANAVVDGAAALAAAQAGQRGAVGVSGKKYLVASFEFDPFDHSELDKVNKALKELDHCVFIDPVNDPYVPSWQAHQCSGYRPPDSAGYPYYGIGVIDENPPPLRVANTGVLYKPLLTHKLVVMKKNHDPVGAAWQIFETRRVSMSNAAPAFILEVKRAPLVKSQMTLEFENGVLKQVDIDKPSEAKALSGFILRTAQTIVSIPVRALVFGRTDAKNRQALIAAQADLIATLRAYNDSVGTSFNRQAQTGAQADSAQTQNTRQAVLPDAAQTAAAGNPDIAYQACVRDSILSAADNPEAVCAGLLEGRSQAQ